MLILSVRCAEKWILGEKVTLTLTEIRGERVRLGITPPAGQPLELREEELTEPSEREMRYTEGGYQVLVWAKPGDCLRINNTTKVRVIAVTAEQVRLGVVDAREEANQEIAGPKVVSERTAQVTADVLAEWVARKITEYLKDAGRGGVGRLAKEMNVSPVTINRWKTRRTNVTRENLERLLEKLNVSLDELANEHGVESVELPELRGVREMVSH